MGIIAIIMLIVTSINYFADSFSNDSKAIVTSIISEIIIIYAFFNDIRRYLNNCEDESVTKYTW